MLCWRYITRCCVGGLTCTTHFQIYVVLEVLDVVLEVYHTQHIFKYTMCVLLEVVDVLEVLPYATHFQTYVVLEVKHVVLGGLPYTTHFQNMLCVITFYNRNVGCAYV